MNPQTQEIIEKVYEQIVEAGAYLPAGLMIAGLISVLILAVLLVLRYRFKKEIKTDLFYKTPVLFLLLVYLYCLFQCTVFSRTPGDFGSIDLRVLILLETGMWEKIWFYRNVVMFVPLGFILPMFGKPFRHILISLPIAVLTSAMIEFIQLKFHLGYCQLDDLIANSAGFLIGFLIFCAVYDVYSLIMFVLQRQFADVDGEEVEDDEDFEK